MFELVIVAAILLGGCAVVQSFRVYEANNRAFSYKNTAEHMERRWERTVEELRTLEKQHAKLCQKIVDMSEELN